MLKKGQERGALRFSFYDIRDYATDKHRVTDDTPYGGGQGMVMKPEPLTAAIEATGSGAGRARAACCSARRAAADARAPATLARMRRLALICGRYEGVDERVRALRRRGAVDRRLRRLRRRDRRAGRHRRRRALRARRARLRAVGRGRVVRAPACSSIRSTRARRSSAAQRVPDDSALRRPPGDRPLAPAARPLRRTCERRPDLLERAELSEADRAFWPRSRVGAPQLGPADSAAVALARVGTLGSHGRSLPRAAAPSGARQERSDRHHGGDEHGHPRHRALGGAPTACGGSSSSRRSAPCGRWPRRSSSTGRPASAARTTRPARRPWRWWRIETDLDGALVADRARDRPAADASSATSARPSARRASASPSCAGAWRRDRRPAPAAASAPAGAGAGGAEPGRPTARAGARSDAPTTTSRCARPRPSFLTGCTGHGK